MWTQMLPQLYGLRVATGMDSSNPATFGTRYRDQDYPQCGSVYAPYASGPVPATSMTAFNHVGDGESSKWDVNIIAEQPTWNYGYGVTIDYPMSKDLSTMLTTTQVVSSLEDGDQQGLNIPAMELISNGPMVYSTYAVFNNGPGQACDAPLQ